MSLRNESESLCARDGSVRKEEQLKKWWTVLDHGRHPRWQTLNATSCYQFGFHHVIPERFAFPRNLIYCTVLTELLGGDYFYLTMALCGYICGMYHFNLTRFQTFNALISLVFMTVVLWTCLYLRVQTNSQIVHFLYAFLWVRSYVVGNLNVFTIFNLCSYFSLFVAVSVTSAIYYMLEQHFRGHAMMSFLDMYVWASTFYLAPSEDFYDNWVLWVVRHSVGWFSYLVYWSMSRAAVIWFVCVPIIVYVLVQIKG